MKPVCYPSLAQIEESGIDYDKAINDREEWRKIEALILCDTFNGDEQAYHDASDEGILEAFIWHHIIANEAILSELEEDGHDAIINYLGYFPHESTRIRHEPFIRALIQSHRSNALAAAYFTAQLKETIKLIRNADMVMNDRPDYRPGVYERYDRFLPEYRDIVKERLAGFLGYVPELQHSLVAELWLRTIMARDASRMPEHETDEDRRAMTLVKYREVLTVAGKPAADASPLLGA